MGSSRQHRMFSTVGGTHGSNRCSARCRAPYQAGVVGPRCAQACRSVPQCPDRSRQSGRRFCRACVGGIKAPLLVWRSVMGGLALEGAASTSRIRAAVRPVSAAARIDVGDVSELKSRWHLRAGSLANSSGLRAKAVGTALRRRVAGARKWQCRSCRQPAPANRHWNPE